MAKKTSQKSTRRKVLAPTGKELRKNGMVAKRADLGADVGLYFATLSGNHAKLAKQLDKLVRAAAPKATAAIKWGMPVYEHHGMLCYIISRAKYVTLGFYGQAIGMADPKALMEGTGKGMRHVKLDPAAALDEKYLTGLVKQAVRANEAAS